MGQETESSSAAGESAGAGHGASLVIGGDLCPAGRYETHFVGGDTVPVFGELRGLLRDAGLAVANLEGPLIDAPSPVAKSGPTLGYDARCMRGVVDAGFGALGLANNHIMDHGLTGLRRTLEACSQVGVPTFGAGLTLEAAERPLIVDLGGSRVALLAVGEREGLLADGRSPGINPLDLVAVLRSLRAGKDRWDHLVVLLHSGNELYPFPSIRVRDICRFLIEEGASAVVCQHSHCVGCYETYRDGHIVYGQGDMVFDHPPIGRWDPIGMFVELDFSGGGRPDCRLHPFTASQHGVGMSALTADDRERFFVELRERSALLDDPERLAASWRDFCGERKDDYLAQLFGWGRLMRFLNRKLGLAQRTRSAQAFRATHTLVQCDLHRDVLTTVLEDESESRSVGSL